MTMTLTNKQTTYNATKIDEALGIKLDGQTTINNSDIIAWQGSIYKDEEYVGNFYYSDNNGRTNINIDTPIGMVDIFNTLIDGVNDIVESLVGRDEEAIQEESEGINE